MNFPANIKLAGPYTVGDLLAFDQLKEDEFGDVNLSEQHNHAITQIELLTNMRVTTDSYKNLPDLKKQYVFRATQMLFKQCCLKVEEYMGAQSVTAQLGEVQAVRQYDFRKDPTMVLQINQLLELAGMITRQRVGDISPPTGGMPTDPMSPAYFPIGGKPNPVGASGNYITNLVGRDGIDTTLSGNTGIISGVELENKVEDLERDTAANKKVGDDNTARLLKTTPKNERVTLVKAGTNMAFDHTADPKDPTKGTLTLNASGGGISTITGTDGIAVTGSGNSRTVSGKTLNDRVTGHGRDIAANRALANTNSAHLLKITPGDKKVTSIRAGTNMQFDYTPNPNDNTKGTLTANASGGGGGITTITGTNGIAVTGTGTQRQISGKAINDRIPPDLRLWAANSGTNDRLVSNNIHACEFYLGASNHHDKGVIMWEGSAVDVPNRATKEMARGTHNDSTGECHCRMGLPGKHSFYYYQKDGNSDGILKLGYGAKEGSITSSQLKALALLKPIVVDGTQNVVAKIKAGTNMSLGYNNTVLTLNAVELELEDGTSVKKVIKKIKAGTNVTFALANDVLTVSATAGSSTDADGVDKFKRLVSSTNQDVLRITNIGGTRIQLHPEFSKYQIFNHLSSSSQHVFNDVSEVKFIERKNGNKTQQIKGIFLNSANFFTIGRYNFGQTNNTVGVSFRHQAAVMPGNLHAYGQSDLLVYDYNGNHSTKLQLKERRIRAGSEASKSFTPTGVQSTYDAKLARLESKIAKLERMLKIKL